jgi:hypothetical protein
MGPFSKPAVPPATAEYVSTLPPAASPSGSPKQIAYRLSRSSDGKTRVDIDNVSVIHDPSAGKSIVLDHVKKEAQISPAPSPPTPGMPSMPQLPGMPSMPPAPQPPSVHVQDLGKTFMQGREVEGKRYTIQPPAMPQIPQIPGMAKAPQIPQVPPPPTTAEVWTNPHLQLPMATRLNGPFGQQTSICQNTVPGEPHPAIFQIPQDYKLR